MHRPARVALAGAPLMLLALSACGGGSSLYGGNSQGSSSSPASGSSSGLSVRHTSLGNVLVDGSGMTVYMLTSDKPNHSTCNSTCLNYWPPVAPPNHGAGQGVSARVGSTSTTTGGQVATVRGWPVYTYVQDNAPSDVTGEGVKTFGVVWGALSPSGKPITTGSSGSSGSTGGSGGS